jgi:hypothetical protein
MDASPMLFWIAGGALLAIIAAVLLWVFMGGRSGGDRP